MAQIDIDKFVIALSRVFGEYKGMATRLDRVLFSLGLKFVDTPTGGRFERVDQPTMLKRTCQGKVPEQKSVEVANKVEPKFKVGDWIVYRNDSWKICNIALCEYYELLNQNNQTTTRTISEVDSNAHLWTIQDAKDGDVLAEDSCIFILQKLSDNNYAKTYCILFDDGDFDNGSMLYFDIDSTKPATKEQREQLEKAMADAGYTFDFEKKELKKIEQKFNTGDEIKTANEEPLTITKIDEKGYWSEDLFICGFDDAAKWELVEQKPADRGCNIKEEDMTPFQKYVFGVIDLGIEQDRGLKQVCDELLSLAANEIKQKPAEWSEEDEKNLDFVATCLRLETDFKVFQKMYDWLKSLRPQSAWKPSEEQMDNK